MTVKQKISAGLAGLMAVACVTPARAAVQVPVSSYSDVDVGAWYAMPAEFCYQHGLIEGAGGDFNPNAPLTRDVLARALYRLEGRPAPETGGDEAPFTDVGPDHPDLAAIRWAKDSGVISGYPDGTFHPEASITREEIAVMLWCGQGRPEAGEPDYTDGADVSDWAAAAVGWAQSAGVMIGDNGYFYPKGNTIRAHAASLVMNLGKEFYGLEDVSFPTRTEPDPNPYISENFSLDDNGYLSYHGDVPSYRGIDVSAHQKEIDWAQVAGAGMDFAMIRAGYRGYTAGTLNKDAYFEANIRGALANGLEVGVYFFSQAMTPREAEEEAYLLLDWIKDYPITYPVVFDWEEINKPDARSYGASGDTVTACARTFCKIIEDAGYTPMTYGSPNKIYKGGLRLGELQDWPAFWLAHYTKNTVPTSFRYHYSMWQYSSTGRVPGIEGNVDLDICLTDWSAWKTAKTPDEPPAEEPVQDLPPA